MTCEPQTACSSGWRELRLAPAPVGASSGWRELRLAAGASSGWRQLRLAPASFCWPPADGSIGDCGHVSFAGPKEFAFWLLPTRASRCCSLIVFRHLLMLVMGRLMNVDTLCFAACAEVRLFVLICYLFIVGMLFVHCLSILPFVPLTDFLC